MHRLGVLAVLLVLLPLGGGGLDLPLESPPPATARLTAIVSDRAGSRLVQVDPSTLAPVRSSTRPGWYDGWVRSPDGKLLAVGVHRDSDANYVSTLRFANAATLRWARAGVKLHGVLWAGLWDEPSRLIAVTVDCCGTGSWLETVDTVAKRVIATQALDGGIEAVGRTGDALVLLSERPNAIAPVSISVVGSDGDVRSVTVGRILGGWHYDQNERDPIGTVRQPGLAVDPVGGIAYVVDAGGLVAVVRLDDLSVSYHRPAPASLLARLAAWLTPAAAAKGANGPARSARWLGDGLIAVTGQDESAVRQRDGSAAFSTRPAGLSIVDTRDWSVRMLDPETDAALVANGVLLAVGSTWQSDDSGSTSAGEGLAAYRADGTLAWRIDAGKAIWLVTAYGERAVVGRNGSDTDEVVDLADGTVIRRVDAASAPWLLLGAGS